MRKRIALDALMLGKMRAGVGNYQLNLIKNLVDAPFDFDVYTDEDSELCDADNINIIKVKRFQSSKERLLFQLFEFPHILNKGNYDLVHFLDYITPVKKLNCLHIVTVHDISFRLFPEYFTRGAAFFKRANLPRALKKSDGIITVSDFTAGEILKYYPKTDKNKLFAVPLGINQPKTELVNKTDEQPTFVLFVGTIEPRKNIIMLIRAMERLWKGGCDAKLIIAGKQGWLWEETVNYAKSGSFADKIIFTGYITDSELEELYKNASLFAFPSLYEGFGLPPLEAMSRGLPVISTTSASLPEALGDAAYYADTEENFSEGIEKILTDSSFRERLCEKSILHAKEKTWRKTAEKTCEVYERF